MEGRMLSTRPNRLLSLTCICHHTGSDLTFMGKPNQFNRFSIHFVSKLNCTLFCCNGTRCTVRCRWRSKVCGMKRKHKAGSSKYFSLKLKIHLFFCFFRCVPLWSLVSPHQETPPADLRSSQAPHQVSLTLLWMSSSNRRSLPNHNTCIIMQTSTQLYWLTEVCISH